MRATLEDAAGDVLTGVEYLRVPEIDSKHIGVIGHSEGGVIGLLAAARSSDIAFVVMLAGTGVTGEQVVYLQGELIARAAGAPESAIAQTRSLQNTVFGIIKSEQDETTAAERLREALKRAGLPDAVITAQMAQWNSPEIRSLLTLDPAETLRKLKAPVLALSGSRDLQVPPRQNLPPIAAALAAGGNDDFTIAELPGLNHLFQRCKRCTPDEYATIEETFSPVALEFLGDWIVRHTRQ